jgi:hypothetical protein
MLKQCHLPLSTDNMTILVTVNHPAALAAQSPFRKEEDVAVTLKRKHGLFLWLSMNWRGMSRRTIKPKHPPVYKYKLSPVLYYPQVVSIEADRKCSVLKDSLSSS